MLNRISAGFAVSVVGAFTLLILGVPSGAQPPSKGDARKILGPGGGKILVYEIDPRRAEHVGEEAAKLLAEALTRRLVPNKLYDITIRPSGKDQVEILLRPKGQRALLR